MPGQRISVLCPTGRGAVDDYYLGVTCCELCLREYTWAHTRGKDEQVYPKFPYKSVKMCLLLLRPYT